MSRRRSYSPAAAKAKMVRDLGEIGERLTRAELVRLGYLEVERVHTPWKIIRGDGGVLKNVAPVEKVSGDFRAIEPGTGRSVLVESKFREDRVQWGDLEEHQIQALDAHVRAGAVSLLSVVLADRAWILRWPVAGFGPGRSIRILEGRLELSGNGTGAGPRKVERGARGVVQGPTNPTEAKVHLLQIGSND